jgi:hypothetical protein
MSNQNEQQSTDLFVGDLAKTVSQLGDGRGADYGHPSENHGTTAEMWSSYLTRRFRRPIQITARDVCMLNAIQKISRDANSPKRDNLLDLAGYAENADRIAHSDDAATATRLDARVADQNAREWRACVPCDGGCVRCPGRPKNPASSVLDPNAQGGSVCSLCGMLDCPGQRDCKHWGKR